MWNVHCTIPYKLSVTIETKKRKKKPEQVTITVIAAFIKTHLLTNQNPIMLWYKAFITLHFGLILNHTVPVSYTHFTLSCRKQVDILITFMWIAVKHGFMFQWKLLKPQHAMKTAILVWWMNRRKNSMFFFQSEYAFSHTDLLIF